jgi:hypothetical protein
MPAYEIYVHCVCCPSDHPLNMRIHLDHGPDHKQSIAESFREGLVPPQLLAIRGRDVLCLKTGKKFKVANDDQFLLVPASFF